MRVRLVTFFLVLAVALAACGAARERETVANESVAFSVSPAATVVPMASKSEELAGAAPSMEAPGAGDAGEKAFVGQIPVDRKIIQNTNLTVRFEDVAAAAERIREIARAHGGYVVEANVSRTDDGQFRGTMTLRVEADRLDAVITEIKGLGRETLDERTSATDVTEEYVDLSARLENLERTERELQALLTEVRQNTRRAEDVLAIYRELTQIRAQIEQIQGRLQYLDTLSALATIQVSLVPPTAVVADPGWTVSGTVRDALRDLVSALQSIAGAAIYLAIVGLPLLALVGIPILAGLALLRRLLRRPLPNT